MKNVFIPSETIFDVPSKKTKIREVEVEIQEPSFWDSNDQAQAIFTSLNRLKSSVEGYESLLEIKDDIHVYLDLIEDEDSSNFAELQTLLKTFTEKIDALEIQSLLSGPFDSGNCIFSLNAGAGGTDAQDWTLILYRMFTRFFQSQNYGFDVVEYTPGDEAGIKSATLMLNGPFAYGYLKHEVGVHRLVRISPFNANGKRQTSFAAVDVIPEFSDDYKSIEIDTKDLKIDTFRASGAGGQHINKTDSAVRLTHIPTGIVSQSQASRSQGANKETAMKILKSRLIQRLEEEHKERIDDLRGNSKDIAWGNQIRSYVFHPYQMVKDHRNNYETGQLDQTLDGDIMPFIDAQLRAVKVA